jgi:hypothetical protein
MNPQDNWSFPSNQMNGNHNQYNPQFNQQISNSPYGYSQGGMMAGSHNQNNPGYLPGQYHMNNMNNNMNNMNNMNNNMINMQKMPNISHISHNLPFSAGNNNNLNYPGQLAVFSSSSLS